MGFFIFLGIILSLLIVMDAISYIRYPTQDRTFPD